MRLIKVKEKKIIFKKTKNERKGDNSEFLHINVKLNERVRDSSRYSLLLMNLARDCLTC